MRMARPLRLLLRLFDLVCAGARMRFQPVILRLVNDTLLGFLNPPGGLTALFRGWLLVEFVR